ncbi:helix-turn-helix domain-containing protein [Kribbella sp. NPDC051770]|uniref:helix-turn-helix domain-containing protein n=1 Tax=Kribbella sp. NPDC051770 TaxID=3155413 RepID=UPI00344553BD
MTHRKWKDVRAERIDSPEAEARVAAQREEALAEQRAFRLAEVRQQHGVTQVQLAATMHMSQAAVSSIERGELSRSELSTIRKYVEALGGKLEVVASFGDEKLVLG